MTNKAPEGPREPYTVGECEVGEWVLLESGWWRIGRPMAGGVGARPTHQGTDLVEDLGQKWPAVLPSGAPVIERRNAQG